MEATQVTWPDLTRERVSHDTLMGEKTYGDRTTWTFSGLNLLFFLFFLLIGLQSLCWNRIRKIWKIGGEGGRCRVLDTLLGRLYLRSGAAG